MSDTIYFQFTRYSQPLLIIFGTIGAIFNRILFFYWQSLRKSSCSSYFRALFAINLLVLHTIVLPLWLANQFQIDSLQKYNWCCKTKSFPQISLYTLSPYLVVLAYLDHLSTSSTNTHFREIATIHIVSYLIPAMVIFICIFLSGINLFLTYQSCILLFSIQHIANV
jgi:hypothetical protein